MFLLFESSEKWNWGGVQTKKEKEKTMSLEKYWRTPVVYIAANITGNRMPVGNAILNFLVKFRKSAEN